MKKIVVLCICLIAPLILLSQPVERTVKNLPIISGVRSQLEYATGYTFQDNGHWISAQNRLPYKEAEYNKSRKIYYKLGKDNFKLLQIRDVMVDDVPYVVFTIQYKTGWYEFPILMELWHWQVGLNFFVFKAEKLKEVMPNDVKWDEPYIINMDAISSGIMIDYDEKTLNSTIAYNIQRTQDLKTICPHNLLIAVWNVEDKGMQLTRFRLIQVMNKKKFYTPYLEEKNRSLLFRSTYYEADYPTFRAFIRYDEVNPNLSIKPKTPEDYFKRGVFHYKAGNFAQAIADLTEAAKDCPFDQFFMTYAYRANAREQMGDFSGAMQDYDKAISLKPEEAEYYSAWLTTIYNRGVAKYNTNDVLGACQDWYTAAEMGLEDASMDANILANCKNFSFTKPEFLPSTTDISSVIPNTADYRRLYFEGMWKYQNGHFREAINNLNNALELQPDLKIIPSIYSYRGASKLKISDYKGAISDFDYCLAYMGSGDSGNPLFKTVYYNRGLANFFLGNQIEACRDFQKALRTGLDDPESLNFIGQVCD